MTREDPLTAFRTRYAADRAEGRTRTADEYLELFPELKERFVSSLASDATSDEGGDIGPYRVVKELGRGGQAVVYLADDPNLNRKVALKVLTGFGQASPAMIQRFRREAELTSSLDHPGICSVYDAGLHDGTPWIAMRYVPGRPLSAVIAASRSTGPDDAGESMLIDLSSLDASADDEPETPSDAAEPSHESSTMTRDELRGVLEVIEKTARALHVAHEAGIVHRDIKPGNVMVTDEGEPVILDFGLAGVDEGEMPTLTRSGDVMGTPAYMAPEQIRGDRAAIDRRTDVYALGVTLFECLTLARPFDAATRDALYEQILSQEAPPPRRHNATLPVELDVICETAMAKEPGARYSTALALAEDLRRVRAYEPIAARPASAWHKTRRWMQRNPRLAVAFAAIVALLLGGAALAAYSIGADGRAEAERELKERIAAAHEKSERERRRLDQAARDEEFLVRMDHLGTQVGTLMFAIKDPADSAPILDDFRAAFRAIGVDLDRLERPDEFRAAYEEAQEREPGFGRALIEGIRMMRQLMRHMGAHDPDDEACEELFLERPDLEALWTKVDTFSREVTTGPLDAKIWKALCAWQDDKEDLFAPLLTDEAKSQLTPDDVATVASALIWVPERSEVALDLIDRAIEDHPGEYGLRLARAGLGLMRMQRELADGTAIIRHLEAAVAIRPEAGGPRAMLASAHAMRGEFAKAVRRMDEATRVESDNPLVWYQRAMFYMRAYAGSRQPAHKALVEEACRKALELQPSFTPAKRLLEQVSP